METPTVKPSGEYINGYIRLTAKVNVRRPLRFVLKARVWRWYKDRYVLAIADRKVPEVFRSLVSSGARALIEVNTLVATFSYTTSGRLTVRNGREFVIFHCPRDFNEALKDLYWFGDFTINVYIPYVNHSAKNVRGGS